MKFKKICSFVSAALLAATTMFTTSCSDQDDMLEQMNAEQTAKTRVNANQELVDSLCAKTYMDCTNGNMPIQYILNDDNTAELVRFVNANGQLSADTIHCTYELSEAPVRVVNDKKYYQVTITADLLSKISNQETANDFVTRGVSTERTAIAAACVDENNHVSLLVLNSNFLPDDFAMTRGWGFLEDLWDVITDTASNVWNKTTEFLGKAKDEVLNTAWRALKAAGNALAKPFDIIGDLINDAFYADEIGPTCHGNWMADLYDDIPVSKISIPGSHDSYTYKAELFSALWGRSQMYDIEQQWDLGIRYFHVRFAYHDCNVGYDRFILTHGGYVNLEYNLSYVINQFRTLVKNHPTETCIVSLGIEDYDDHDDKMTHLDRQCEFNEMLQDLVNEGGVAPWKSDITLGEARGKMILFTVEESNCVPGVARDRYGKLSSGYDEAKLLEQNDSDRGNRTDDNYKKEKVEKAKKCINEFDAYKNDSRVWCENYLSGFIGNNATMNYAGLGEYVNPIMEAYIKLDIPGKTTGIVAVDFAGLGYEVFCGVFSYNNPNCKNLPEVILNHNKTLSWNGHSFCKWFCRI